MVRKMVRGETDFTMTDSSKFAMYRTARLTRNMLKYRELDVVAVSYEGKLSNGIHYFAISREGFPIIVVSDDELTDFVL